LHQIKAECSYRAVFPTLPSKKSTDTFTKAAGYVTGLMDEIKMKAYYRLAFALWKCGGGALKCALNVLCQARDEPCCTPEGTEQLSALEDVIIQYIEKEIMEEDRLKRLMLSQGTLLKNAAVVERYKNAGIKGLLRTTYTRIRRELYPWDERSLSEVHLVCQMKGIR